MTFHIVHLGCAKNQVDAELMAGSLLEAGWTEAETPEAADLVLVNTCGFVRDAQRESIDALLEQVRAGRRVVATGCLSQRWAASLLEGIPELTGCFGNRRPEAIGEFLSRRLPQGERLWLPDAEGADLDRAYRIRPLVGPPFTAYVKVSEGCDHHCTYCAIPLIRGHRRDRPLEAVLAEARALLERGVRELALVAHDLASYGEGLPRLVEALDALPGEWWLRLLYIYPERFPEDLIPLLQGARHLVPYLDIPFQHGSQAVLNRMGRRTDPEAAARLIDRLRDAVPGLALRTTFITGFRGETEAEFEELLAFQARVRPDWAGIFAFSHEEGTAAWNNRRLGAIPPRRVVLERKQRFEERQATLTEEALRKRVGQEVVVLVEEVLEGTRTALGRAPIQAPEVDGLSVVRFDGPLPRPGDFVRARVTGVRGVDLIAQAVTAPRPDA